MSSCTWPFPVYCSDHFYNADSTLVWVPVSLTSSLYSTSSVSSCTWPFSVYCSAHFYNADSTLVWFVIFIRTCRQKNSLFPYSSTRLITRVVSFCVLNLAAQRFALLPCEKGLVYPFCSSLLRLKLWKVSPWPLDACHCDFLAVLGWYLVQTIRYWPLPDYHTCHWSLLVLGHRLLHFGIRVPCQNSRFTRAWEARLSIGILTCWRGH